MVLTRRNNLPTIVGTSQIYSDHYGVSRVLTTSDDGMQYQCEVVINNTVMTEGSITLDVMGEYTITTGSYKFQGLLVVLH